MDYAPTNNPDDNKFSGSNAQLLGDSSNRDLNDAIFLNPTTPVIKQDGSTQPVGMFQCAFCKKCYNRADHLQRHVRSHSGEKPYACHVCSKTFGRPDLLKRHAEGHLPNIEETPSKRRKVFPFPQASRVAQACRACSASKLKCDESKPCNRCRNRGLNCEPAHPTTPERTEPMPMLIPHLQQPDNPATVSSGSAIKFEDQLPTPCLSSTASMTPIDYDTILESDYGFFPKIFGIDWSLGRSLRVAADYVDQGVPVPHISASAHGPPMDSLDWNSKTFNPEACRSSMLQAAAAQGEGTSLVAERSGSNEEDAFKDEVSLALPPMLPTKARRKPQTQVLRENLDYTSRDRILNLVIKNVQRENVEKIVRSFPATELYDDFMQHFFNESTRRTDDWIHAGTFRPNQCPAELLTPIIATGAVYQDQHVLRTIGYAMLEQVRRAIPKTVDLHHTMVKDLDIQQGYLLQLETRQYCANARKVEMAEAAFQQAVTMLRRNRQFRRCEYGTIFPTPLEDPETLEDMWKKWAKQEQKKRTVFHLLLHDVRAAFTFNTTPLIHFSELTLPLPESDYLWRANSAQEWAALYSRRSCLPPSRLPSLVDALQDITILSTNAEFLDLNYSMSIVIHGSASLIFQHRQIRTLQSQPNWHNPAVDSVAYTKCSSILNTILMAMKQLPPLRPEVMMMHAYHSSQLYISIEELHFVAGKADREDAVRAYESAKQWVDSPSSRYAAWYAAQVIRHARMAETRTIKDFLAVSLYHTALLLWTYGVLSRARTLAQTPRPPLNFIVMLDNDGSDSSQISEVQAFLHEGRGSPSIRHSKVGIAPLEDPTIVMDEIQTCIGVNWSSGPPELVKGTRRMISDLGAAAKMPTESRKSF